jgi:TatD DNase family protein
LYFHPIFYANGDKLNNQKLSIVDTHAHLDMKDFDADREAVLTRAIASGVKTILTVGTDVKSSETAIILAEKHSQIYTAVGIHPHDTNDVQKTDIARISELAKHQKVVALGEMGLDFYRNYAPRDKQFQALSWQLQLASELCLPVVIHARQSAKEMIEILGEWIKKPHAEPPGVIHCFSDNIATSIKYLEMGFYLAFGGFITYPNSQSPEVIKTVPQNRLLVETDCPFLPPQKYRGKRNEPSYTVMTVETMAGILGISAETVARRTTENARRLFKF